MNIFVRKVRKKRSILWERDGGKEIKRGIYAIPRGGFQAHRDPSRRLQNFNRHFVSWGGKSPNEMLEGGEILMINSAHYRGDY